MNSKQIQKPKNIAQSYQMDFSHLGMDQTLVGLASYPGFLKYHLYGKPVQIIIFMTVQLLDYVQLWDPHEVHKRTTYNQYTINQPT